MSLLVSSTAEAQFFKKLQKKIEDKVEKKVIDNVSDKAAKETEKSLEKMWDMDLSGLAVPMGGERVDASEIPASYSFDWEYLMDMKTKDGNMEMAYLIKEDAPHFGIKMPNMPNMFMVLDTDKQLMVMYMTSGENKMISATKIDPTITEDAEIEKAYNDAEMREIGSKEILGYDCQGYQTETEDHLFTFYVTDEAEVSFSDIYKANEKNMPKGYNPEWFKDGNALMMEMLMEDKKDPSKNVTMTCTKLEKNSYTLNKSDYQAF